MVSAVLSLALGLLASEAMLQDSHSSRVCAVTDPENATPEQIDCLGELTERFLGSERDFLIIGAPELPAVQSPDRHVPACSRFEPEWPVTSDGKQIEIDAPIEVEARYMISREGHPQDIEVTTQSDHEDANAFVRAAHAAVTYIRCNPSAEPRHESQRLIFDMTE